MEGLKVVIGGREIPLRFRMNQFIQIEEEIGNLADVQNLIMDGEHRLRNMIRMIRILGNAGLKAAGEDADLTEEWLTENMDPYSAQEYSFAALMCLSKESKSQAAKEEQENKERDLVLEEIEAKKDPVNSHTGE